MAPFRADGPKTPPACPKNTPEGPEGPSRKPPRAPIIPKEIHKRPQNYLQNDPVRPPTRSS
eukprot:5632786-Pyramimonas_sp.AAC.1